MTKVKRFFAGLMATIACFAMTAFVACDKDDDKGANGATANAYTITVTNEDGDVMANVSVGICDYDSGRCTAPKTTDENGQVVFKETKATYVLNSNISAPSGYEWKQDDYQFTEYGEYTIVLVVAD